MPNPGKPRPINPEAFGTAIKGGRARPCARRSDAAPYLSDPERKPFRYEVNRALRRAVLFRPAFHQ